MVELLNHALQNFSSASTLQRFNCSTVMLPHKQIELKLQTAVRDILPDADVSIVLIRPCPDPKFGDYQSNALMSLAKQRKMNPRQLAENVLAKLDVSDVCERVEIAGAGFLNFRLKSEALTKTLEAAARGEHLFFEKTSQPKTVVIDFSSPNVAKPMHVGHIRSTILGDSLARTLGLIGHRVVTDNHIGDWGTQFGMLILAWKAEVKYGGNPVTTPDPITTLENLYKKLTSAFKYEKEGLDYISKRMGMQPADEYVTLPIEKKADYALKISREELVKLQAGDAENIKIWREMIALSQKQFDEIYSRLGVKFDVSLGESFYNDKLAPLVDELLEKKIARESEGAIAIFFDDNPQLKDHPALIRKSDGGFNYTTTDLATLDYRASGKILENPELVSKRGKIEDPVKEIIYVTDGRQQLHFQQVFAAFTKWQSQLPSANCHLPKLAHVWFGSILGEDGKPFKTRSGETVKLSDLLDEAEARAEKIVSEKNPELPEAQRKEIARVVGLGAVKYADLLPNRQSDYIFSWDKMLALNGNTAPYLQYACARIKSIFRKAEISNFQLSTANFQLSAPEEIALAKHLLNFGLTLEAVAEEFRPNFLCNYLFELAGKFTAFYENCPVLKADDAMRDSRLALCDLIARVLKQGLDVLGIEVVEQM
jgi:arginyl-tRNA synthetase